MGIRKMVIFLTIFIIIIIPIELIIFKIVYNEFTLIAL